MAALTSMIIAAAPARGAITILAEHRMGEAGSVGTDNISLDTSGNGRHMESVNGTGAMTVTPVGVGSGPEAAGSTSYLSFDGNVGMSTTLWNAAFPVNNFAVEFWVRFDVTNVHNRTIRGGTNTPGIFSHENGTALGASYNGKVGIGSVVTPAADTWYHLAIIRDDGVSAFYVDGIQTAGTTTQTPDWDGTFYLGQNEADSQWLHGDMDEFRIFSFDPNTDDPVAALAINSPIREAATSVLLSLGVAGLLLYRRPRRS